MADVYKVIRGVMGALFKIGGPSGPQLKNSAGVVEARNTGDSDFALVRGDSIPASGSTLNDLPALLDLRGRVAQIEYSFAGGTPPSPAANTGKFGFCHTAGGAYTAGEIVYDDGTSLIKLPSNVSLHVTTTSAITGTVSMIANGIYSNDSGTWTLKGDGSAVSQGRILALEIAYAFGDTGGKSSTTNIPDGARVLRVRNRVTTLFDDTPTLTVIVDGTADETILETADSDLTVVAEYHRESTHDITSSTEGPVEITVGGSPTVGAGTVIVEYVTPLA